jgi:DNA-binding LacI/PurR family transcriptional regulator
MDARRVYGEIRALALKKGPGFKLPTTRELSVEYDTNRITLDNALRQLEENQVIYRRQGSGIFVSQKIHRKTIVVLLNSLYFTPNASPFWGMLWALLAKAATDRAGIKDEDFQFHMLPPQAPEGSPLPERIMSDIEAGKVDGILGIGMIDSVSEWLESQDVPMVSYAGPGKWMVYTSSEDICRIGVNALADDGRRAIGLWTPVNPDDPRQALPLDSFLPALVERGLAFNPCFVVGCGGESAATAALQLVHSYQEQGYYTALRLFGDPAAPKPDGLVINDDMMADGAIAALEKIGIRVGEDVKIASHTILGSPTLFSQREKIARIEYDTADILSAMLGILDDAMSGREPDQAAVRIVPTLRRACV